ncbi:MAG: NADH dehydrogenase [Pseudonocardia sp. SCN 72-86]|nr:MAG: NADH dehydrogenase [Pseudonocardia sp. SCN 72-86]
MTAVLTSAGAPSRVLDLPDSPGGPLPRVEGLIDAVDAEGLRGRGGAGFPTATKMRAVLERAGSRRGRPVVVGNGCEGEPASHKDATLLARVPHLVVDGAVLSALALGGSRAVLCVGAGSPAAARLRAVVAERADPVTVEVVEVPERYVASQETALVRFLGGGPALPTTSPPRPSERGVAGRPTFVTNVETLARIALIARHGPSGAGSLLLTVGGAVTRPGVVEVPAGTPLGRVLDLAGGPSTQVGAILTGGYGGTWLTARDHLGLPVGPDAFRAAGAGLGAGVLLALPADACGPTQTLHLLRYLARESARQCGPCRFGLPAIAGDLTEIVDGHAGASAAYARLTERLGIVDGRGACSHPDGAVRLVASALHVFAEDVAMHLRGLPCRAAGAASLFPVGRGAR